MAPRTLLDKIWEDHVVRRADGEPDLLYIDLHLVHEVTSPQAFESLQLQGRPIRRPDLTLATIDHGVPTEGRELGIKDPLSKIQIDTLVRNCETNNITLFGLDDPRQGIVHVIGPEQGITQPGMTIVCGDSHTATHGAFGALAFGIGTSEVEHVLATQTLPQLKPKAMAFNVDWRVPHRGDGQGHHPRDHRQDRRRRRHRLRHSSTAATAIEALSMEGRMTICNMSIEAGARAGFIAPDETTFAYLKGRPKAPQGAEWDAAVEYWRTLHTDDGAQFEPSIDIDASTLEPHVSWGTNPAQTLPVSGIVPSPRLRRPTRSGLHRRALQYMDLEAGRPITAIEIDRVFLGSCTNGRIEDLRAAAAVIEGKQVKDGVHAMVVPGPAW